MFDIQAGIDAIIKRNTEETKQVDDNFIKYKNQRISVDLEKYFKLIDKELLEQLNYRIEFGTTSCCVLIIDSTNGLDESIKIYLNNADRDCSFYYLDYRGKSKHIPPKYWNDGKGKDREYTPTEMLLYIIYIEGFLDA